jgi:hypothetical protein
MSATPGDIFNLNATPNPELRRRLDYLAQIGSGAVLTPYTGTNGSPSAIRRMASTDGASDMMRFLAQQQREEQIRQINQRLDDLDRRTDEALRSADERLAEILRTANRAKDGRVVFLDEDGKIYDENDNEVGRDEINWDNWNPDARPRGDYQEALQDRATALAADERVDSLRARVNGQMTDEEIANVSDELTALEAGSGEFAGMSYSSATGYRSTSAAKLYDADNASDAPSVGGPFIRATVPVSVTAPEPPSTEEPAPPLKPS